MKSFIILFIIIIHDTVALLSWPAQYPLIQRAYCIQRMDSGCIGQWSVHPPVVLVYLWELS